LERRGFLASGVLRADRDDTEWSWPRLGSAAIQTISRTLSASVQWLPQPVAVTVNAAVVPVTEIPVQAAIKGAVEVESAGCGCSSAEPVVEVGATCSTGGCESATEVSACSTGSCAAPIAEPSLWTRIRRETLSATLMIAKFMLLAFTLEALILLFVPQESIVALVGTGNPLAVPTSALVGVPIYTTNLTALPLVAGLLGQGMLPGAALAFLIAGPTTTLPAMAAVYGIAKPRVFAIYVAVALVGAIIVGYAYQVLLWL
jgi:hypothetical protein